MRNRRQAPGALRSLLLVTVWGLPLLTPLLRWTAVPCTHDGHLHYHRIAAMRHAWENGLFFTRWLPDLAFGYGYPFFLYREPTPLYAAFFPHLWGLPLPAATNLFYGLTIVACGWMMYLWVRDILGDRAALVAAVAYMAAPYVLVDTLIRGNAPESLALPLFPLLLWAGRRWLLSGEVSASSAARHSPARYLIITVLTLAFLSLSHNISTLLFVPTLLVYLLALAGIHRLRWATAVWRLALPFVLGLGMTLFYTAGALLEMDQVTLQQSTTTRNNDFHYNFTTVTEILAPVATEDPQLLNPPLPFRLGWTPLALALLGVGLMIWRWRLRIAEWGVRIGRKRRISCASERTQHRGETYTDQHQVEVRWHVLLMLLGTAVYLFMSLPFSLALWENLPLIDFVQFPWRFVGRAALPLSFLAGVPFANAQALAVNHQTLVDLRLTSNGLRIATVVACAFLILEAIPNLYPNSCSESSFPTINDVHEYERVTGLVGVDPEGSYFPRTVAQRPKASLLEADYQAGQPPQRLDISALSADAVIDDIQYMPLSVTAQVTTPAAGEGRYLSFAFPGWVAAVDGERVPITPGQPDGLITFPIPAGTHTVSVHWQATPLRIVLAVFSLLALVATGVTVVFLARTQTVTQNPLAVNGKSTDKSQLTTNRLPHTDHRLLLLLPLVLLAAKLLIFDQVTTPLRRTAPPPVTQALALQGGELRLEGFNLSRTMVPSGGTVDVDMAWTAVAPPQADYQTNVWLQDAQGLIWSAKGTERPRTYEDAPPTRLWQGGQWAWDSREIQLFPGTPPGEYDIILTLFDKGTLQPLTLSDANDKAVGPTAVLGQITVTKPEMPLDFAPRQPLVAELPALQVRLLGFEQDRDSAAPGELVQLILFWERAGLAERSDFSLKLMDDGDQPAGQWSFPLTRPDYLDWLPGERLRGQYLLRLPASVDSGDYQFVLEGAIVLGTIQVNAPERVFQSPAAETAVSMPFQTDQGNILVTLIGYTSRVSDESIALELVWSAAAEMPISYRVFVHLVDENGQLLAQSDGEPAQWTRPTTGWAPGEYVIDPHDILLPPEVPGGLLSLRVGLYDPGTGRRLRTETADFITLPTP